MNSDKYIHSEVEDNIYSYWEKNKLFKPSSNKSFKKHSLSKFERRGKEEGRELFEFNYKKVS